MPWGAVGSVSVVPVFLLGVSQSLEFRAKQKLMLQSMQEDQNLLDQVG